MAHGFHHHGAVLRLCICLRIFPVHQLADRLSATDPDHIKFILYDLIILEHSGIGKCGIEQLKVGPLQLILLLLGDRKKVLCIGMLRVQYVKIPVQSIFAQDIPVDQPSDLPGFLRLLVIRITLNE